MANRYYGTQKDENLPNNERSYLRNIAVTSHSPGYPDVIVPNLPYSRIRTGFSALPGSKAFYYHDVASTSVVDAPSMSTVVDSATMNALINNTRTKSIADLNGKMRGSQFSLAVTALEGKKTVQLIAESANRITKAYRNVRKGKFSKAAELLLLDPVSRRQERTMKNNMSRGYRGFQNNWLKYRYGIKPLIGDVYNSIDAFTKIALNADYDLLYKGYASDSDRSKNPSANQVNEMSVKAGFHVTARCQDRGSLTEAALGLDNPALVVWELIPFSFVFDWFVPVGNFLEAMKIPSGFSMSTGCEFLLTKQTATYKQKTTTLEDDKKWSGGEAITRGASADFEHDQFTRTVIGSFPTPSHTPSLRSINQAFNLKRSIDAVTLLTSITSNPRRK